MPTLRDPQYLYWKYTSAAPTQNHAYLWPPVIEYISTTVTQPLRILDAGCGAGGLCKALSERFACHVSGFDLSESGIAIARQVAGDCRFEVASAYDDLREVFGQRFDFVVSLEVVEHLYDPRRFVSRLADVLTPGGLLMISSPYHGYLKNLTVALIGKCDRHYNPLDGGGHIKFWSKNTLGTLLNEAGFDVTAWLGVGRCPYLWKSMIAIAQRREAGLR